MLSRKAILILLVLILVMLASDIWQVSHGVPWSYALFCPPVLVMSVIINFVRWQRAAVASADALAAWKKWGGAASIFCAVIFTVLQLQPVVPSLGISLPSSELIYRLFIAGCGLVIVVLGNRAPKLSPVKWRRPGVLFPGTAEQLATSRLMGWLMVSLGVTMIVSALFLSRPMWALAVESVGFATFALIFIHLFERIVTKFRRGAK